MTPDEQTEMALLDVLDKRIKERLDYLKGNAKDHLSQLNLDQGIDSIAIDIDGEKVGSITMSYTKPKVLLNFKNYQESLEYLESIGLAKLTPNKGWESNFKQAENGDIVCKLTGEIVTDLFDFQGQKPYNVRIAINQDNAVKALRPKIAGMEVTALLGA